MLLLRASVFTPLWAGVSTSAVGCGLTPRPSPTGAGVTGQGRWSLVTPCHHQRWEHQLIQMPVSVSASNLKKKSNIDLLPHIMQLCMLMICKFDCKSNVASNTCVTNDICYFIRLQSLPYSIPSQEQAFAPLFSQQLSVLTVRQGQAGNCI